MEDGKWKIKMEGDDALSTTLGCLRGRLLAEREASRFAKEEAQLMENKLIELEKQVKEETKLRKKAEKKLKLLMKKLESLNIIHHKNCHCSWSEIMSCKSESEETSQNHINATEEDPDSSSHEKLSEDPNTDYHSSSMGANDEDKSLPLLLLPNHQSVTEALDALRRAREKLMERRRHLMMIKVT